MDELTPSEIEFLNDDMDECTPIDKEIINNDEIETDQSIFEVNLICLLQRSNSFFITSLVKKTNILIACVSFFVNIRKSNFLCFVEH